MCIRNSVFDRSVIREIHHVKNCFLKFEITWSNLSAVFHLLLYSTFLSCMCVHCVCVCMYVCLCTCVYVCVSNYETLHYESAQYHQLRIVYRLMYSKQFINYLTYDKERKFSFKVFRVS